MKNVSQKEHKAKGLSVTRAMILWLIEEFVRKPPYITTVTKKQLWWGNGIFRNHEYSKGLIRALDLRHPSTEEKAMARMKYGYDALRTPEHVLNPILNSTMRNAIQNQTLNGGKFGDIRVLTGRGYVREDGTLDPRFGKGKSCYVLFLADHRVRDGQNEWLRKQPKWKRQQVARNIMTHADLLNDQIKSAKKKIEINKKLIKQQEYLELDHNVPKAEIPWEPGE